MNGILNDLQCGLLRKAGVQMSVPQDADEYEIYDVNGHRPAGEGEVDRRLKRCADYKVFVPAHEFKIYVKGSERRLSELLFQLLCYRLARFRSASPVDDVYEEVWSAVGQEKDTTDYLCAVRSAAHDINARLGIPKTAFMQVTNHRVSWKKPFEFCLVVKKGEWHW